MTIAIAVILLLVMITLMAWALCAASGRADRIELDQTKLEDPKMGGGEEDEHPGNP